MTRAVPRSIAAMGAAVLLFSAGAVALAAHSSAATPPPWEASGTKDPSEVGTLALYNSAGKQVTTGSVMDSPIAAYDVGSKADTVHPKATEYLYTPLAGTPAGSWTGQQLSASTAYPVTGSGVPPVVSGASGPVFTGSADDESIASYIDAVPNVDTSTAGYVNAYQLRIKTSTNGTYQSLDLVVSNLTKDGDGNVTGGTWTETFPGASTKTTTTLAVSPASASKGKAVTLTATETPHVAGKVQFLDNKKNLGKPVAVATSTGKATLKTSSLPVGKNSITAKFTPTSTSYSASTSAAKTVTVKAVALKNTKKPSLSGPGQVGKAESVSKGSWSPGASSYSYQWYVGGSKVGGATKSTFKPASKDAGKSLECKVTAKKSGYKSATATSNSVKIKK